MRILWLSHLVPYPPKGGVLQRAHYMLKEVAKYHDVELVAFNQVNLIAPFFSTVDAGLEEAKNELEKFCQRIHFLSIPVDESKSGKHMLALKSLFSSDPYTINWLKSNEYAKLIAKLFLENKYDLVHFDTISLLPYFKYIDNIPAVLDHHNIESHMLLRRAENESVFFKRWYYRQEGQRLQAYEKKYCPKFSLNITCSEVDADRLRNISSDSRVEEVANGVDIDFFKPTRCKQNKNSLLFIGRMNWYPNAAAVRYIAQSIWPVLKQEIPGVNIDIIGANPPDDLQSLAAEDPDFRVHGFVDDIHVYFNKAAVYLCPIMDGGGTKLKILDALSMNKAIVAHPIACEGISVTNGENVMFAESVDEYVAALKKLFDDEGLRDSIGRAARRLIEEKYSYDKIGKKLSDLYIDCAQK